MRPFVLAVCLALSPLLARAEIVDIDNRELAALIAEGVPVVDIRLESEWQHTGIVADSHLLTFFDERGKADPAAWLQKLKPVAAAGQPVILICRTGNRTRAVARFLAEQAGYSRVYNVRAGIMGWLRDGGPVTPAAPRIAACRAARTC